MSLVFENPTPFSALYFDQIDQHDETFHVFVARVAYHIGPAGEDGQAHLRLSEEQPELVEEDQYFGRLHQSAVRAESDLAPYKPCCDVIVNAHAHSPDGRPSPAIHTRLKVQLPSRPASMPEKPQGLNPYMAPSFEAMQAWRAACDEAKTQTLPGKVLVDKAIVVNGERWLQRHAWPVRFVQTIAAFATLGLIRPNPWRLTRPRPFVSHPIHYDDAIGGECRINANDPAADRVPKREHLGNMSEANDAGSTEPYAVLHDADERNPIGRGYATRGYLKAARPRRLAAPQIEYPAQPFTAGGFWQALRGKGTRYRYNGHDLPIERIDAKGQTLHYRYDKALRLAELVNGNGEVYRFAYDAEGRLMRETGFDGKTTTYTYDNAGQLIASDCNGKRSEFMRDALGLLLAKSTGDGSVRYGYDALGRLTAIASPHAEQRFAYDAVGQLIEERDNLHRETVRHIGTATERLTATRAYDPQSRLSAMTLTQGRQRLRERRYGYDAAGNLTDIEDSRRGSTRYLYDPLGQLLSATQPGLNEIFAFDPASNLLDPKPLAVKVRRWIKWQYIQVGSLTVSRTQLSLKLLSLLEHWRALQGLKVRLLAALNNIS